MQEILTNNTVKKPATNSNLVDRLGWVDYARGLAILLVVYRHTMVGLRRSGLVVPDFLYSVQEFLLNVRMPVFFVLSGVFLGKSLQKHNLNTIFRKKASGLLYPYILWSVIFITMQIFFSDFTNSKRSFYDYYYIIAQPRELDHMWYLLALFNTTLLLLLCFNWLQWSPISHLVFAVALYCCHFLVYDYSLVSDIMYNYIFLVCGYLIFREIKKLEKISLKKVIYLLLLITPIFIAGQLFWLHNIDENYQPYETWYLLPFLLAILIASMVFYLVSRIMYMSSFAKWLAWIGRNSLYIYILHILVISTIRIVLTKYLGISNIYLLIFLSLALGVIAPVFIYRATRLINLQYLFSLEKSK